MIALLRDIFEAVGLNLYLFPYGVLPTGPGRGIIEVDTLHFFFHSMIFHSAMMIIIPFILVNCLDPKKMTEIFLSGAFF